MKIQVYDPPMCCPTGICGPSVDPALVQLAADLETLRRRGVEVERHNLAQEPAAFATNPVVVKALKEDPDCLPITIVDGEVVFKGYYPNQEALASLAARAPGAASNPGRPLPMKQPESGCCGSSSASKGSKGGCCG